MTAETVQQRPLLGANMDWLMIGGYSLILFAGFHLFVASNQDSSSLSWVMFYMSFFVNYPHFILSYQLLYWDHRQELLKKPAYLWAGVIVPTILIFVILIGLWTQSLALVSLIVQVMYVTVGWHYVKQIFGTMVVISSQKLFFFSPVERKWLLANLYSLWALSFLWGQKVERVGDFYGVKYDLMGVSDQLYWASGLVVGVTLIGVAWSTLRRYIKTGQIASLAAWVSFISLYAWYIPTFKHRHFFLVVPFFHSLQYLLFVIALKRNLWRAEFGSEETEASRKKMLKSWFGFFGASALLGVIFFWALPKFLDLQWGRWDSEKESLWGPTVVMALFHLFINIHHYFIDNVIWTNDNKDLTTAFHRTL